MRKQGKRPLLAACDIYRPAAIQQLETVGAQLNIPVFQMGQTNPVDIAKEVADIILLDSLQESPEVDKWITPGALTDNEKEWLREKLSTYSDKPVLVTSHHSIGEVGIKDMLLASPTCCGYIHGHDHVWRPGWSRKNYSERSIIRTLCVPSTGHWGDIGYSLLHLEEDHAEVHLKEYEYFFPRPLDEGEAKPSQWKMIEDEHRGAVCSFAYKK